jgi:F0F1-type ATP synthase membrane subunit c/vacuolar-type H+-ATPase subunit K
MITTTTLYFSSIAATVAINSIAVAIGESLIAKKAIQALNLQPQAKSEINRTMILGLALNETAALIGLVISVLLLLNQHITAPFAGLGLLGIICAICLPGSTVGLMSAGPIGQACLSVARQPFFNNKINNLMLVTISFIQTAVIFGFIIALFILYQLPLCTTFTQGVRLLSAGLCIGIGCIGSVIGLSIYATQACASAGYNRHAYLRTLTFTFVSQALIETPIAFALVTTLMIMRATDTIDSSIQATAFLSAALCTGISNINPGINSGRLVAKACQQISYNPENYANLSKISLIAQGFLDSLAIYGWAISLLILLNVI